MKTTIIVIVILAIIGIGIYFIVPKNNSSVSPTPTTSVPDTSVTQSVTVDIKNFSFSPSPLTIKIGTKVTWINNDSVSHTITSDSDNLLNSPTLSPGQSFSFTFTKTGTERYHCAIHTMMKGNVVVE